MMTRCCEQAKVKGVPAKIHDCRRNWTHPTKAMEANIAFGKVKKVSNIAPVKSIIGEDDTLHLPYDSAHAQG